MPWVETGKLGGPDHYRSPLYQAVRWDDEEINFLLAEKMRTTKERDSAFAIQKSIGAKIGKAKKAGLWLVDQALRPDFEDAKYAATEAMKFYRACCFLVGQIAGDPPGDSREALATKELAPYIDRVYESLNLFSFRSLEAKQLAEWKQMGELRP